MTYAAAAKERSRFIGDNLKKKVYFCCENSHEMHLPLENVPQKLTKSGTAMQEPFLVSSMAVLYLYKDAGGAYFTNLALCLQTLRSAHTSRRTVPFEHRGRTDVSLSGPFADALWHQ